MRCWMMTKINVHSWEEFEPESVFSHISRGTRLKVADRIPGDIPLVTAGFENYGIADYVSIKEVENKLYDGINITIDMFGNVFLRDEPFICDDNILVLSNDKSKEANLFLVAVLTATVAGKYSYKNQFRLKSLDKTVLNLPVTSQGKPNWKMMEEAVEVRHEKVSNHLNSFKLTLNQEFVPIPIETWKRFLIDDLFEPKPARFKADRKFSKANDVSEVKDDEFSLPLTNAKHGDNGIMYYGRPDDWNAVEMSIDVVANGAIAVGDVYVQVQPTATIGDSFLMKLKNEYQKYESENVLLFLATVLEKTIKHKFSYDHKSTWNRVRKEYILLPVTDENLIDWQYMEEFISSLRLTSKEQVNKLSELIV